MAPRIFSCCHCFLRCSSSNSKTFKANYLIIIPGILSISSCLLILIYISTTTNYHHHHHHHPPLEQKPAVIFVSTSQSHEITPSLTDEESELNTAVAREKEGEESGGRDYDQEKTGAALFGNTTSTTYSNSNTSSSSSSPRIRSTPLNDSSNHRYDNTISGAHSSNASSSNSKAEKQEEETEPVTNLFHDKDTFMKNYREMNKTFKIYVYPHSRNHPFANALLPLDNHEPGGNYASETYFKKELMKSHFITKDASEADLFFLPFSIATLRHDRRVGVGGLQDFISVYIAHISREYPYWNRTGGADHFYVACHSIGRYAMEKAQAVKMNAIQVLCSSNYFLPNYVAHKDVCLPQIWPRHGPPHLLSTSSSNRKKLAFFAGAANSPVRQKLVQVWKNDPDIFVHSGRLKTPYADQLLSTKFCLHVKGFEVNTARIGDALYYGCVPVVLADYYDLPFMDILNWKSFSVVVHSLDIHKLKDILGGISADQYDLLRGNVLEARRHFQWNRSPLAFDAFYMVMYELWLRRSSIRVAS